MLHKKSTDVAITTELKYKIGKNVTVNISAFQTSVPLVTTTSSPPHPPPKHMVPLSCTAAFSNTTVGHY